jgi:hypothetical protein
LQIYILIVELIYQLLLRSSFKRWQAYGGRKKDGERGRLVKGRS